MKRTFETRNTCSSSKQLGMVRRLMLWDGRK
jgi:hypothetical protein